ncbi:alpha/beta hydrolase family protein [Pseudomarimonas salicorniae]|uniref:S9 family peptidase n=1 Tax=Pseudomarimonas salicorniae TaxID=2933270 RepID=A0ABT0GFN2_9GAMM|nr:S9 family peptidase [Lysobacter sp. CAU 1642]MCK7593350.1 S9 family peptidase [Lysobacter sp. CAU 1642]
MAFPTPIRAGLIAGLLTLLPACALAAERGLSPEDLVSLDRVSDPQLRPGAGGLAYVLREADLAANKASTAIWYQALGKQPGAAVKLTTQGGASSPRWSADGRHLYFLSARSGSNQVWRLDLGGVGGEAQQVTSFAVDVGNFRLSPKGDALALSLEVFPDCPDLACTAKRLEEKAAARTTGMSFDKLFVRHWDSWKDGRRNQLFVARMDGQGKAAAEPVRVSRDIDGDVSSKPFGGDDDYAFSPDGSQIAFSARIAGRSEPWSTNFDIYLVPADGSAPPRNLTEDNPAWDAGPVFSADGKTLYYRAMKRPGFEADRLALVKRPLAGGTPVEIAPDWDRSADGITLDETGKHLYTTAYDLGEHRLFRIRLADGAAQRLVEGGGVGGFSLEGSTLVFTRDSLTSPAQLFLARADGSQQRRISEFNAERLAAVGMGEYQQFRFAGWNDETVHGYVVKPWNYKEGGKYPVAFIIHGGPQGSMGNSFHYRWNPQTYAAKGWAVVFIDFHGSTGYGQAFTDSISGDWGGKPLVDLQKGWQYALSEFGFLDGERACALGASYGGYMVNWIAGNWQEPWDCLVSHAGVFDNRMMGYSTEELWFDEWEMGGTPYEVPANYEKHNPVAHVAKWKVPMLVIHGQLDYRIPVEQGIGAFTALQRQGIESRFLYFPDENHWILKPANSVQWHQAVNDWLAEHLSR